MEFKLGAHQMLWKSNWTDEDLQILDQIHALGLDLFEVSIGDDVSFDAGRLKAHAAGLGIELSAGPGNEWPIDCDIASDDPAHRRLGMDWHRKAIDWAASFGAVAYCGATYGHPGVRQCRPPCEKEIDRVVEGLRELAAYAEAAGVKLVIEPMSKFRVHLVTTARQAMDLAGRVGHPNLLVNFDTYHMITEERDYGGAIRSLYPALWGVHACENDRGVPGGGLVPWDSVFAALAEAPGTVRIMMEGYNTG
ncbi:MAG TPA: sugar phosphate isomerase/epimerase family protein, partial [Fimbriimonadaceae bacterium]|nr:sugar phosphate isomerase/epimerase family protein [Fimbriimonadaceae bacterium]